MAHAPNFKLALTPAIEPSGGPGAELATLEDAAHFVGLLRSWRWARPHRDFAAELSLKAAQTPKESDIETATSQMERALRVEGVVVMPATERSYSATWSASSTCSSSSATSAAGGAAITSIV
jgi:hypothetical protein